MSYPNNEVRVIKEYLDVIVRYVPNYGFLPMLSVDGVEVYRGEFKTNALAAHYTAIDKATELGLYKPKNYT